MSTPKQPPQPQPQPQPPESLRLLLQGIARCTNSPFSYSLKTCSLPRIDSKDPENVQRYFVKGLFCEVQSRRNFQQMVSSVFIQLTHGTGMIFFSKVLNEVCLEEIHFETLYSILLEKYRETKVRHWQIFFLKCKLNLRLFQRKKFPENPNEPVVTVHPSIFDDIERIMDTKFITLFKIEIFCYNKN